MVCFTGWLLLFTAVFCVAVSDREALAPAQHVLGNINVAQKNPRKLKGRFLHITVGTDPEGEHPCHQGKGGSLVGLYGAATTECDSPLALVNATFQWIEHNIKDEIDFVVWTGDSARHDNDDNIPRSDKQVEHLNRFIVSKFVEVFGKSDNIDNPDPTDDFVIPIVPTYGNNDILPHNIFEPGPNQWTKRYLDIWSRFVPEEQRHSFARGGWFFTEVIPSKLAVISLNTLYFFDSNAAVDGCDLESEPGYEHMEWLRIQLHFLRDRKMKAILMGHVPPARTESKQSWDETCYQKYTLWQRQYRDVIVANIFGHMNIDHFMFQDVRDLKYRFKIDGIDDEELRSKNHASNPLSNDDFSAMAKATYINELRANWASLPAPPKGTRYFEADEHFEEVRKEKGDSRERKKFFKEIGGKWGERFSMSIVSPSIVPNYFPTLRIIEYNITGLEHEHPAGGRPQGTPAVDDYLAALEMEDVNFDIQPGEILENTKLMRLDARSDIAIERKKKKKKGRKKKPAKPNFPIPRPPAKTAPPGPAFSPQTLSLISWTQFYANLTEIHLRRSSRSQTMEDKVTSTMSSEPEWFINARIRASQKLQRETKGDYDKHFKFKVEYTTVNDSVYKLPDLTLRSWLDLAERIGRTEYKRSSLGEGHIEGDEQELEGQNEVVDLGPESLDVVEDSHQDEAGNSFDSLTKSKKKGKKPQKSGRLKKNRLWRTFVKRLFVQTKSESDLEDDFD